MHPMTRKVSLDIPLLIEKGLDLMSQALDADRNITQGFYC